VRLNQLTGLKDKFVYQYDFGDGWEHGLVVEKVLPADLEGRFPRCLDGARRCPAEDCGGPWGYGEFLEAILDPTHPDHDEKLEWFGGEFDPEAFDVGEVNQLLQHSRR